LNLAAIVMLAAAQIAPAAITGVPLAGEAAEEFLRSAEVVDVDFMTTKGITKPRKVTLSDGQHTYHAVFKTVDTTHSKVKLTTGRTLLSLRDSYKHEIAAYELDKLLGLGIVPPTVERRIGGETGSLTFWVYESMTEWHRRKVEKLDPPDIASYNNLMHVIKLFMQLTWDADYNNASNILIDQDWKLYKIDSSRAFRTEKTLRRPAGLTRFSKQMVEALESLDRERLELAVKPWLSKQQRAALWKRSVALLRLAEERVAKYGEEAVLF
jgi:hypothetical protein